jgi:glutamine synthetase
MAAVLAAGLDGIERGLDPGPPYEGDAYGDAQLRRTPRSLVEALVAFEESAFVRDTFGKDVVEHYAAHGRGEWEASLRAVTDWEINRAFEQA